MLLYFVAGLILPFIGLYLCNRKWNTVTRKKCADELKNIVSLIYFRTMLAYTEYVVEGVGSKINPSTAANPRDSWRLSSNTMASL